MTGLADEPYCRAMAPESANITTSGVARRLGVSSSAVRKWIANDILRPDVTTPGGHYRFSASTVEQLATRGAR